jgi:glycosyltransferase involved in cell wall biosynthesis
MLHKRGYSTEANIALMKASGPFELNGEAHEMYSRLMLPLIFDSLNSQVLISNAFAHGVNQLIKSNSGNKKCPPLVHSFDTLPLIRFSSDVMPDELDHLFTDNHLVSFSEHDDIMRDVSKLFYTLCPVLHDVDDIAQAVHDIQADQVAKPVFYPTAARDTPPKIRVTIVSSKMYNHETLKAHGGLLNHLTRSSSELDVKIACWATIADQATKRVQSYISKGSAMNLKHPIGVADIDADYLALSESDVILYLDLPLDTKSFALAHRRIATVQVAIWGHHTYSTQIPTIDYMIVPESYTFSDKIIPTSATSFYSEQVVQIPGLHIGLPYGAAKGGLLGDPAASNLYNSSGANFRDYFLLPTAESVNIYVLPCSAPHLSPSYDHVIKDILRSDKNAYVLIGARENVLAEQESPEHSLFTDDVLQHGYPLVWAERLKTRMKRHISGGRSGGGLWRRVRFLDALSSDDYAAVLSVADVVLDTFPHGNLIPSLEAMYFGTPVVTLGSAHRKGGGGQVSAVYDLINSKLKEKGAEPLNCCDAGDEDEYVELAVRLASDWAFRQMASTSISNVAAEHIFKERRSPDTAADEYLMNVEEFLLNVGSEAVFHRTSSDPNMLGILAKREAFRMEAESKRAKERASNEWEMTGPSGPAKGQKDQKK